MDISPIPINPAQKNGCESVLPVRIKNRFAAASAESLRSPALKINHKTLRATVINRPKRVDDAFCTCVSKGSRKPDNALPPSQFSETCFAGTQRYKVSVEGEVVDFADVEPFIFNAVIRCFVCASRGGA